MSPDLHSFVPWLARSLVLAGALSLPLLAASCDDDPDSELERQADSAGEELQEAGRATGEALEAAGEEAAEVAEEGKEKLGEAMESAGEHLQDDDDPTTRPGDPDLR